MSNSKDTRAKYEKDVKKYEEEIKELKEKIKNETSETAKTNYHKLLNTAQQALTSLLKKIEELQE
jgi:hypothetical protein